MAVKYAAGCLDNLAVTRLPHLREAGAAPGLFRLDGKRVFVLSVMRGEMRFRKTRLIKRDRDKRI